MSSLISGTLSSPLTSILGWTFIPNFATKHVLSFIHRFAFRSAPPPPQGTRLYHQHYALTFALVVLGYLSFNLITSAREMPLNFYQILGVPSNVDENGLKYAFRQFVKRNHPDRPEVGPEGEELFIIMRDVYEALKDPVVRFAYDRFGPDVLKWDQCTTMRDYIHTGLMQSSGYHIVVGIALVFWTLIGGPGPVSFWRYLLYAALFAAEISLILSPSPSQQSAFLSTIPGPIRPTYTTHTILHTLFPHRLIHQHVRFLHQLFLFLSIALSRVVPMLVSAFGPPQMSEREQKEAIERLATMSGAADREASIILHTLLHSIASPTEKHETISSLARPRPFNVPQGLQLGTPPPGAPPEKIITRTPTVETLEKLAKEIEELIVEGNIKKEDGPLRSVWEAVIMRARSPKSPTKGGRTLNFWEVDVPTEEGADSNRSEDQSESSHPDSGEGGPDARKSLPSPITPTVQLAALPISSPARTPGTSGRARSVSY